MGDDDSGHMGKFLKWGLLLLLFGLMPPLFFVWIGWKYVKLCVLFYFKMLYLIIRFPIWLFIQLPLYYIGVGVHKVSDAFSKAYGVMMAKKKRYGLLFGILLFFTLQTFLPSDTDAVISFLTEATLIIPLIFFLPFFLTFIVAFISAHFKMPDIARKEMPGTYDTGVKRRTAEAGAAAASAGAMGVKAYKNADEIKESKEAAESLATDAAEVAGAAGEGALAGDMVAVLESMPLLGTMVEGGGVAAGAAGGAATTIAGMSGGTAILAFILVLFLGLIGFVIISFIISIFLWGTLMWLTGFLAPVISPILGAIGLGQAYGNWIGSELANNILPQINLEAEMRMIEQAGAKIGCALKGPACLRQWRLNNTARPGSEDVGEKYTVKVQGFSAGGQGGIDIAYKRKEYNVPVSFLLLNSRHGLKGIPATNVNYRVRIVDADRTGEKAYCSTGWKSADTSYSDSTIMPGTSFSPRITDLDQLTLEKCEMLQPALGHDYTAKLDVKYRYSSQSTLYVQAMSRENMRSQEITPEFKESQTADTPVETYINVKAPVTYVDGENRALPFTVKVGTATDRYDVEYYVHTDEFEVIDSSKTERVGDDSCIGLAEDTATSDPNDYRLSDRVQSRINQRVEVESQGDPETDLGTWFDKAKSPSPARCSFELKNPGSISPTGETLTFRVDANYTINIESTSDPFEVKNTRCSQFECPILFYLSPSDFREMTEDGSDIPPRKWKNEYTDPTIRETWARWEAAMCNGIDAGNGCAAMEEYYPNFQRGNISTQSIEQEEVAIKWNSQTANANNMFSCYVENNPDVVNKSVVGIEKEKINELIGDEGEVGDWKRLNYSSLTDEFDIVEYEDTISDSGGIPYVAEVKVEATLRAGTCTSGEEGYRPDYEVVSGDIELGGAAGFVADIGGYLTP